MNDKNLTERHNSHVYDTFLMHWKYISRKRVNGKWQYQYEDPDAYDRNATVTKNVTTTYKNGNKLLDSTTKVNYPESGSELVFKERGKISQSIDKGKDWINKKMYGYSVNDEYDRNATANEKVTTKYKNSDKLLSSTKVISSPSIGTKEVIKERGKIAQAVNKGQAYVNAFLRDRSKKKKSKQP